MRQETVNTRKTTTTTRNMTNTGSSSKYTNKIISLLKLSMYLLKYSKEFTLAVMTGLRTVFLYFPGNSSRYNSAPTITKIRDNYKL